MRQPSRYVYVAQVGEWAKVGITSDTVARGKRIAYETGLPVEMVKRWILAHKVMQAEAAKTAAANAAASAISSISFQRTCPNKDQCRSGSPS